MAVKYRAQMLEDVGSGCVNSCDFKSLYERTWHNQMGRTCLLLLGLTALGQPTQMLEGPGASTWRKDLRHVIRLSLHRLRKRARSRNAEPWNNRSPSPSVSNVMGWSKVRRAALSISGISPFSLAIAYARNAVLPNGGRNSQGAERSTSARI